MRLRGMWDILRGRRVLPPSFEAYGDAYARELARQGLPPEEIYERLAEVEADYQHVMEELLAQELGVERANRKALRRLGRPASRARRRPLNALGVVLFTNPCVFGMLGVFLLEQGWYYALALFIEAGGGDRIVMLKLLFGLCVKIGLYGSEQPIIYALRMDSMLATLAVLIMLQRTRRNEAVLAASLPSAWPMRLLVRLFWAAVTLEGSKLLWLPAFRPLVGPAQVCLVNYLLTTSDMSLTIRLYLVDLIPITTGALFMYTFAKVVEAPALEGPSLRLLAWMKDAADRLMPARG